jgi:hypothetical protein
MLVTLQCFSEVSRGDILQTVQPMVGTHLSMGFSVSALCLVENEISCVEGVQKHQVLLRKSVDRLLQELLHVRTRIETLTRDPGKSPVWEDSIAVLRKCLESSSYKLGILQQFNVHWPNGSDTSP